MASSDKVTLDQISRITRQIIHRLAPLRTTKTSKKEWADLVLPSLDLPTPQPIKSILVDAGLASRLAEDWSQRYIQQAAQLKQQFERNAQHVLRDLMDAGSRIDPQKEVKALHTAYVSRYVRVLDRWTQVAIRGAESLLSRRSLLKRTSVDIAKTSVPRASRGQAAFSPLEPAFEENLHLPHYEKKHLSRETGLESGQEHSLTRRNKHQKVRMPLDISNAASGPHSRSSASSNRSRVIYESVRDNIAEENNKIKVQQESFTFEAPQYAFPTSYRTGCMLLDGSRTSCARFETPWRREALPQGAVKDITISSTDIDDLIARIANLTLDPPTSHARTRKRTYTSSVPSRSLKGSSLVGIPASPSQVQPRIPSRVARIPKANEFSNIAFCSAPPRLGKSALRGCTLESMPRTIRKRVVPYPSPSPAHSKRFSRMSARTSEDLTMSSGPHSVYDTTPPTPISTGAPRLNAHMRQGFVLPSGSGGSINFPSASHDPQPFQDKCAAELASAPILRTFVGGQKYPLSRRIHEARSSTPYNPSSPHHSPPLAPSVARRLSRVSRKASNESLISVTSSSSLSTTGSDDDVPPTPQMSHYRVKFDDSSFRDCLSHVPRFEGSISTWQPEAPFIMQPTCI